jgi:hypothetical protein
MHQRQAPVPREILPRLVTRFGDYDKAGAEIGVIGWLQRICRCDTGLSPRIVVVSYHSPLDPLREEALMQRETPREVTYL